MEIFLIRALQLILCFSLLIILHEGGHFFFAKLFKVRVEKFCLFFDPWKTLLKFKPKNSDTTYCLGWLPLGGYVKISGMIDESLDNEQMKRPAQSWEFRSKPAWQRLLILLGGVLVNFILAFIIYIGILFTWGESYIPIENYKYGFKFNEQAKEIGFKDGDIILQTDNKTYTKFDISNIYRDLSNATSATVLRNNSKVVIPMPGNLNMLEMIKNEPRFIEVLIPSQIDSVIPNSPAAKAGIKVGDHIVGLNGKVFNTVNDYSLSRGIIQDVLSSASHSDSLRLRQATLLVRQNGSEDIDTLSITLDSKYNLGIIWRNPLQKDYKIETHHFNLIEAIPKGINHGWNVLTGYVNDLKYLFTSDGAKSVGSFGAIGSLFPTTWDWPRFWELTAFISLILAFMNVLPIPALDGGHAFFTLIEVITRRKPSDEFMEKAQVVGMILLFMLMGFAIFNDFRNFLF